MNLAHAESLIRDLKQDLSRVQAYYGELERGISSLMDRTFKSDSPDEKVRLAALELRVRGVLERHRKWNVN